MWITSTEGWNNKKWADARDGVGPFFSTWCGDSKAVFFNTMLKYKRKSSRLD
jgi:hypothetical protein